jgi:ABC-2 type transport system permease protein
MPIFDQGYQHWKGTLSGRAWRWLAITRHGVRGQFRGRLIRLLLLLAWLPALLLVGLAALGGLFEQGSGGALQLLRGTLPQGVTADPHVYRQAVWTIAYATFFKAEIFYIMALMVVAGPNLISRDLRFNALPLYFARPLTRLDYFLGKLGVLAALVAAVAVVPAVVAYALGVCFSLDLSVVRDTWRLLPASILYGLVIVVSAGPLMLALSSLSRRSLYVGIAWAGLWVISSTVASTLENIHRATLMRSIAGQEMLRIDPDEPAPQRTRGGFRGRRWEAVRQRVEEAEAQETPTNWRPLCSYTANLERVGEALLNTDAAWVLIGRAAEVPRAALTPFFGLSAKPSPRAERRLADKYVLQYPWIWSAGVLAGLLGLSLWTLSIRVKSLDRLR